MSQVALIVRLGLLVRSAAAGLEALRDYLGRWNAPGGLPREVGMPREDWLPRDWDAP